MKNIYEQAIEKGVEIDNHCSDLYLPVNETTKKLVDGYEWKNNVTMFVSNIDGVLWYDIPFAYIPYAEKKLGL